MSTCAVIPFYNEFNTIRAVVVDSLKFVDAVIAINDGSRDHSEREIETIENVILINLRVNSGKGEALKTGFERALKLKYDKIVTLDADLQHDPELIPYFLRELEKYEVVIVNRLNDLGSMPLQRRLSNKITSFLLSLKTGQKILDSQCGFRGYNASFLMNVKTTYSGFEAESEILVLGAKKGIKIGFIEIPTKSTRRKSKMRPFKATMGFLKVLINK